MSLITTGGQFFIGEHDATNGSQQHQLPPLSTSYHSQSPRFSPQNSLSSGPHSIIGDMSNSAMPPLTPTSATELSRPSTPGSNQGSLKTSSLERSAKTNPIDRGNDPVYTATTNVVKAIMTLSQGVEKAVANDYLDLVKNVGIELRALLASVDILSRVFPAHAHKYENASCLNSDKKYK